jgi:hypothetical protein
MRRLVVLSTIGMAALGCSNEPPPAPAAPGAAPPTHTSPASNPDREAYFGDLHVHTRYSFDAFIFGARATPDDAYRFAKGETIQHPAGFDMSLRKPLDFQAVTDHDLFLGMFYAATLPDSPAAKIPVLRALADASTVEERRAAFAAVRPYLNVDAGHDYRDILDVGVLRSTWQEVIAAAERHNDPGRFTTFIAYEYTSGPDSQNLHRNVVFRGSDAPVEPFSVLTSQNPEDLWEWMDAQRDAGIESIAIPHNSNGSNGQMFAMVDFNGQPFDAAYAEQRMRNEPIVEVTQVKGTSETHPALSRNDEWADFEIMKLRIGANIPSDPPGSYVREAYRNGLDLEARHGFNPYRFGLIGSSDTHVAAGSFDESNYWGKIGLLDATPQLRGSVPTTEPSPDGSRYRPTSYQDWGASGLAGVWAEANTREAIFDALRRKETFATTGPRMRVRFFAGYGYGDDLPNDPAMVAKAYRGGVPMGGDLLAGAGAAPRFLVWATADPDGTALQRVQVIKGWLADGRSEEKVFDVACADGGSVDPATQRCPDNGATVNLVDCSISADKGAAELRTLWTDPEFDPSVRAFYYVRALENPTCRWSTWDAIRAGVAPREGLHATIQERAWSSPIWYRPVLPGPG